MSKNLRQRIKANRDYSNGLFDTQPGPAAGVSSLSQKRADTVGELKSAEICVSYMPSLKAKKPGKPPQEKALLEP